MMQRTRKSIIRRAVIGVIVSLALGFGVFSFNLAVQAGELEPPASAFDENGNPKGTMKTLDQIQPTWSQLLPAAERFVLVMGDAAVLDKETGLVWERDPGTIRRNWNSAISYCARLEVGGRKGWSLPLREQLASLVDTSNSRPTLPTNHPFLNIQLDLYWSASTDANGPDLAWGVNFISGDVFSTGKGFETNVWCVRGGQAYDGQDVKEVLDALP